VAASHNLAFACIAPLPWMRAGSRGRRIQNLPSRGWDIAESKSAISGTNSVQFSRRGAPLRLRKLLARKPVQEIVPRHGVGEEAVECLRSLGISGLSGLENVSVQAGVNGNVGGTGSIGVKNEVAFGAMAGADIQINAQAGINIEGVSITGGLGVTSE
jgi:hypothetical protein